MLRHILFDVEFFANDGNVVDRANSRKRVLCLLEALVWINRLYLQQHPETPLIYQSGIKYIVPEQFEKAHLPEVAAVREYLTKKGASEDVQAAFKMIADQMGAGEHFRDIPQILANGGGDCDNVASWRAAELRELGIDAKPYITWRRREDGGTTYHVIVLWPDGSSEDPSLLLGMGGSARDIDRLAEQEKLGERTGEYLAGLMDHPAGQVILGEFVKSMRHPSGSHRTSRRKLAQRPSSVLGTAITTPQNFNQLQYTIPFQSDDAYEDWSPTRPQAFYANPLYPSLPTTPGGGPIFNTRMRDSEDFDDDRFDGDLSSSQRRKIVRELRREFWRSQ